MQTANTQNTQKSAVKKRHINVAGVVKISLTALAFALLLGIIFIMVFPNSPINFFGVRVFLVSNTRSMEPDMSHNDLIIIRRVDFNELEVGDIVTFKTQTVFNGEAREIFVTHKIIEAVPNEVTGEMRFRTSGTHEDIRPDARLMTEYGYNATNQYIGRLVFHAGFLGNIFAYLRSPFGITMLVVNVGLIVGVFLILQPSKAKGDKKGNIVSSSEPVLTTDVGTLNSDTSIELETENKTLAQSYIDKHCSTHKTKSGKTVITMDKEITEKMKL